MNIADHQFLLFPPTRPLAERFGAEFFRSIPESPGVYFMSTARDGVLYVGKAKNLRRRLGSYRSGTGDRLPRRLLRLLLKTERIDWDVCPDEAAALNRERELIRALRPRFNSVGLRPPKEWFIGWSLDDESFTMGLVQSPTGWPQYRGPFVFPRPAFAALLRSLWLKLHPGASVAVMPPLLLHWNGPYRFSIPWSEIVSDWLTDLDLFLEGRESPLMPSIRPGPSPRSEAPKSLTFDEQWQAMDAECLLDFYERLTLRS